MAHIFTTPTKLFKIHKTITLNLMRKHGDFLGERTPSKKIFGNVDRIKTRLLVNYEQYSAAMCTDQVKYIVNA